MSYGAAEGLEPRINVNHAYGYSAIGKLKQTFKYGRIRQGEIKRKFFESGLGWSDLFHPGVVIEIYPL